VLAQLRDSLGGEVKHSVEKNIVSLHQAGLLLLTPMLFFQRAGALHRSHLLAKNLGDNLTHVGARQPAQVLHNRALQVDEVLPNLPRHGIVKTQEGLIRAPQVESVEFEHLKHLGHRQGMSGLKQVQLCGVDDH
jgi:hypothetical protein